MEFKDILYSLRKEKGYSQEALAQHLNVSRQTISKWENGSANPDLNNLTLLSSVLNVSVDTLLGTKEMKDTRVYGFHKEYISKRKVFGIPLIHISFGRGRRHVAKGIIAIGNIAVGCIAIGFISAGIVSFGILTLGLFIALGVLSLSYFAIGALAIGYIAVGALAIGAYSIGAMSIGYVVSTGALSYGITAIGPEHSTYGESVYIIDGTRSCIIGSSEFLKFQDFLAQTKLPTIVRLFLEHITRC